MPHRAKPKCNIYAIVDGTPCNNEAVYRYKPISLHDHRYPNSPTITQHLLMCEVCVRRMLGHPNLAGVERI